MDMTHLEQVEALRARTDRHYNCCQAVLVPYAMDAGLTEEQAMALSEHFGGGMRTASVCGAVTGGLMALGLAGREEEAARDFQRRFRAAAGSLDCAALLRTAHENGEEKKPHCDRMVFLAADIVEELLRIH